MGVIVRESVSPSAIILQGPNSYDVLYVLRDEIQELIDDLQYELDNPPGD